MIKFGTDGWRAIIAEDFTFANVEIVAQSIANYVNEIGSGAQGLIIGYDNRFLSEHFAQRVGEVLAGNKIPAFVTAAPCPTPVTAYAILEEKAAGAIMITASHNPPEYNGIKFIPWYAGPAVPAITNRIEECLESVMAAGEVNKTTKEKSLEAGLWKEIDPKESYLNQLAKIVDLGEIGRAGLKIVLDPMFGAGIGYLEKLLENRAICAALHDYRDPLFGGTLPEPTGPILRTLRKKVLQDRADLGLALDGDADRFGIIDDDGTYISPNQVLSLLYYHLVKRKGLQGPVARTVATTHLLDKMAHSFGQEVVETPVGFKYIGQMMREKGSILGGEESGGLSIAGHIPEKDGILAAALMAEIRAATGKSLQRNLQELADEFGRFHSARIDVHTSREIKEKTLNLLQGYAPKDLAGIDVKEIVRIDGVKILLADDSWVLIRPSGTEPLFRIYTETQNYSLIKILPEALRSALNI
ncbi:phosphoglucomutase/phosphomannomutase family protein [Bacillota bacterium LX-D]|nr:phosphoglucomutase/phosphomannomutase family protein [Bacillota bacterium LX-D]